MLHFLVGLFVVAIHFSGGVFGENSRFSMALYQEQDWQTIHPPYATEMT
ncbi:MAG: hypothetical protein J6U21_11360 [Bacteroidales bacterium]|nr:hypothetical protein [Bacteroidales bacterium]